MSKPMKKIKVLVVDDSKMFRTAVITKLSSQPDIEVVGEAYDPYGARDLIIEYDPDVITLDIQMPYMNGLEFLRILTPQWKVPVIVASSSAQSRQDALRAGAAVFLQKPISPAELSTFLTTLLKHIRLLAGAPVTPVFAEPNTAGTLIKPENNFSGIVAIGASAGGTQTTTSILKRLPPNFPGIVVVQHMPQDFTRTYAESLDKECKIKVKEAEEGDAIARGTCLIAPGGDRHCEVVRMDRRFSVHLRRGAKVSGHCPSVDVLFQSVADAAPGRDAIGVILTGMGADGANGLLRMKNTGSLTIGQDEHTSIVYGMPKVAYDIGAVTRQASLENIPLILLKYLSDNFNETA